MAPICVVGFALFLWLTGSGVAATFTWDGGHAAQDRWSLQHNWNPNGDPPNDGTANLIFAGSIRLTPDADGGAWSVNSIMFSESAGAFSVSGGTLTLQGSSVSYALANNSANLVTISNALALGANQTWSASGAGLTLNGTIALGTRALTFTGSADTLAAGAISGTGSLVKTDAGTLTLSGVNTYSGGTTVSAGTLVGTTTSLQGNIVNNAAVVLDQAVAGTYTGVISGTGSFTKSGLGTTELAAANTYTGATNISGGTLALTAANALADNTTVNIASGATLQLSAAAETVGSIAGAGSINLGSFNLTSGGTNASTTFSGVASGTGALTKTGSGTLTLEGANTYSGGTTVSSGTLLGSTTSLQGNIANHATLVFDQAASGTYAGVISGTGAVTKQNTGTLTLAGANTYTGDTNVNAGTLALGSVDALASTTTVNVAAGATLQLSSASQTVGAIAGAGAIDLGAFTLTTGDANTSTTFSGAIGGTGALTKTGTGTLILAGANTYSGGTTVSGGVLQGTTTSLQGNIVNHAGIVFDQTASGTYSGAISGSGTLTKQGSGTVTLNGANTHSGTTTVNAGTLALGASNAFSAASNLTLNTASSADLGGFSVQVGTLAYHTAIIDFGAAATTNAFLFTGGGASTGTLTINNYNAAQGDVFAFETGASGVTGSFVSGVYFYGIGGGVLGATGQSVSGYAGLWDTIVPDTSPFKTWDGGGTDNKWSTGANWSGDSAPVSSFTLKLAFDGATRTAPVMDGSYNVNTLRFESGAAAYSLTASGGASTLSFGGSVPGIIQLSASDQNLDIPLALTGTTIVETTGAGTLTLAGEISGAGGITKLGENTLVLAGGNSFGGATTVNAGTLILRHSDALGSTTAGTTVSGAATLQLESNSAIGAEALALDGTLRSGSGSNVYGGAISGSGTVTVDAGTLTLNGSAANTYSGATTVNAGQLDLAKTAGVTAIAGNLLIGDGAGSATVRLVNSNQISDTSAVTLAATGTPTFNLDGEAETIGSLSSNNAAAVVQLGSGSLATGGDNTSTTFAGVISGTGELTKQGTGTFTLSGANTYSGATTISGGTIVAQTATALGTAAGGTTVSTGATLQIENDISIGAEALVLNGTLRSASGANTYAGAISGSGVVTLDAGTLTLSGSGANTFTGLTTVNTGQLDLAKTAGVTAVAGNLLIGNGSGAATVRLVTANQISDTAAVTLAAGGTPIFNLNSQAETIGSLASINAAAVVQLGSATLATGGNNASTTFAGVISGTGGLTKQGTGTFTLTNTNTYSGATTVAAGTLALGASNVIADTSNLTLGSGATLTLGGTFSEQVSVLSFNSSTIDFGTTGTANNFLFSDVGPHSGTLTVANWTSGTDVFGVASGTVSQSFLDNVFFSNLNVGIGAVLSVTPVAVGTYGNFYTLSPIPTFIWDGGQSNGPASGQDDWSQGNNWSGNIAPAVGAMKALVMAGSVRLTNDMNGAYQANSLLFRSDAGAFTLTSSTGDTLTLGGGGINNQSSNLQTLNVPIALGTSQTWTAANGDLVIGGASVLNNAHTLSIAGDFNTTISAAIGTGSGGLVKNGTGTLTLSGANTFTGGVTLNAGVVSVGSDTHLGAASGGLTFAGGTLRTSAGITSARAIALGTGGGTFDSNGYDSTFSGAISGTGSLLKTGAGTLSLSGANAYTGGTTVSAGTLRGTTSSLPGNITNNAALVFDQSSDGTFAGVISGTGSLTKQGTGTVTMSGAHTYSGGTTVSGGTLRGNTTSLQGNIVNHATVAFDQASSGTFAGAISGTGSVTKLGASSLTLTGVNSYSGATSISAGMLTLGGSHRLGATTALTISSGATFDVAGYTQTIGSLAGAGTLALGTGSLTFGGDNTSTVFGGAITGTGVLEKTGTGTLTFGGNISFAGELKLSGGTLALAGFNLTVDTLRISGDTILDFGPNSSITATHVIIENNHLLQIDNWVDLQNFFYATGSLVAFNTGTLVTTPVPTDQRGTTPLDQLSFTGFAANTTVWQGYDRQITPAPEPATYGACFLASALGLVGFRRWRSRRKIAVR